VDAPPSARSAAPQPRARAAEASPLDEAAYAAALRHRIGGGSAQMRLFAAR
jgi:hypothetical protein